MFFANGTCNESLKVIATIDMDFGIWFVFAADRINRAILYHPSNVFYSRVMIDN